MLVNDNRVRLISVEAQIAALEAEFSDASPARLAEISTGLRLLYDEQASLHHSLGDHTSGLPEAFRS